MKLTIIHTTSATLNSIPNLIQSFYNDQFEIVNLLDDSLLNEIKATGEMTKNVINRLLMYVMIAKNNGSDAILSACSSIGKALDIAREIIDLPIFKIDEPMAELASKGNRILVLGTVESTLKPSTELIKSKMDGLHSELEMKLIPNIFELCTVDKKNHDEKIASIIEENLTMFDTIVLAQASMADAKKYVHESETRILTSLPLGIEQLSILLK